MNNIMLKQKPILYVFISIAAYIFLPGEILGQAQLIQHLDASVESSIISDGSGALTEWKDQTSFNNHATPSTGAIYKVNENNLGWLDFGADHNALELFSSDGSNTWLNQSVSTGGFCVFLTFKINSIHSNWNDIIGNSSTTGSGFGLRYSNSGTIQYYLGDKSGNGSSIEAGDGVVLAFNYNATSGRFDLWDSKSKSTVSGNIAKSDFSLSSALTLGGTTNNSRYFDGYIGEVKIFNNAFTDEDFQNEQNSLFVKWLASDSEKEPPTPDPAGFAIAPAGVCGSIISMTATLGSDISGPVEYLFTETTGNSGGSNSGWQTNPNFRDGDLNPSTEYRYTVSMRDAFGNIGTASAPFSATTTAHIEPGKENELEYGAFYGYQGWHFAEGDGRVQANDWVHWFEGNIPDAEHIHGDMWPDLREYDTDNLYDTDMKYPNGETVKIYSGFDYSTIDLHVKWMKEYGIKGCVVQRFTSSIDQPNKLEQGDKKIQDVMTACEKYGVKFWIMHDSGSGDENEFERVTNDWKHLVDDLDVLQSPAYTWQNGLPVYGLWGAGISSRSWLPEQAAKILDFHQFGEEKYHTYVAAGVPVIWRTNPPDGWKTVFDRLDMISPWRTIFNDPDKYKSRMQDDLAYCNSKGIDYNPVVSPGASTKHMRDREEMRNWKPRDGGHFLWKQVYEVCKMGSKFMYVAMFDEVDEGTAMYKLVEASNDLPIGADQVPLNEDGYDLPSDWYLQIGTELQKMLEGSIALTEELPLSLPSPVVTATYDPPSASFNVYPVPAEDVLYISNSAGMGNYKIISIDGIHILEGMHDNNSIIINTLKPGLYLLQLDNSVIRFIKK